jgi:AraC-like DNA-binding protein
MDTAEWLQRLGRLAKQDTRDSSHAQSISFLSAFVTRRTEKVQNIAMPVAGLLVVVEGRKIIYRARRTYTFDPGMAFTLPAGTRIDVINEPDPVSGIYRALFLGFPDALLDEARRRWASSAPSRLVSNPTVTMTPALASAVLHVAEALVGAVDVSSRITDQRVQEVLLTLVECGAAPLRPELRTGSASASVRGLMRQDPARTWTVAAVAAELGTSEPTLRRRLAKENTSFRQILAEERMSAARTMLVEGKGKVAEAALLAGYASLSHFTKRFRCLYGELPSRVQIAAAIT